MQAGLAPQRGDRQRGERGSLVALAVCLTASLALYGALALVLGSLPAGWDGTVGFSVTSASLFRAFTGLPAITLSPGGFARALVALLVLLWGLWGASARALRGVATTAGRRRARGIVLGGAAAMLLLVIALAPPLLSADLYRQAVYGRMVLHGVNPYSTPAAAAIAEPLRAFANHVQVTTSYGPAYTWLSTLAAALAPAGPVATALAWKTMAALAAFGCVAVAGPVARALAREGDASDGLDAQLWLGWSPLLVIEAAASGHIEPVMMLPALGGLWLLLRGRPLPGFLLLVVSTLTKWVTGLVLLLAAARQVRQAAPGRRLRALLGLAVPGGLLAAALYAPFATGLSSGSGIHDLAFRGADALGDASKNWLPEWVLMAGFAAVTLAVARAYAGADWPRLVAAAAVLMIVFILVVVPWLFAWYFLAPMALAAVLPAGRARFWIRFASVGLGASVMLYYAKLVLPR